MEVLKKLKFYNYISSKSGSLKKMEAPTFGVN